MMRTRKTQQSMDVMLVVLLLAMLAYGLLMLYSATFYVGQDFWLRQLQWIAIGALGIILLLRLPYTLWHVVATPLMLATLIGLLFVLLFGETILGAQRTLIGASIQPGVIARLVAIIYIAAWLSSKGTQLYQVRTGLIPFAVIVGVVAGLVALQPDLSTAILLTVTGLAMFFFAGGDPLQLLTSVLVGGGSFAFLAWQLPHARGRLLDYMQALKDPNLMPYHLQRSLMALGEGGLTGVGIGNGRLKFGYLPFPHTDSVFAVIGEEAGLLGTLAVIGLFALLAYRGYRIALETPEPFGSLVAFGVTTMLVTEAMLNILVMVGLLPFTGTALPFFSYGGTEMVVSLLGMGLLLSISRGRPKGELNHGTLDHWWRNWRTHLSGSRRSAGLAGH